MRVWAVAAQMIAVDSSYAERFGVEHVADRAQLRIEGVALRIRRDKPLAVKGPCDRHPERQHGVRTGYWAVGFDINRDMYVDLRHRAQCCAWRGQHPL